MCVCVCVLCVCVFVSVCSHIIAHEERVIPIYHVCLNVTCMCFNEYSL